MSIDILRRLERFHLELGSQDPADWTLEAIDQAREAILAEVEARHFHLKTVEEAILDHQFPPPASRPTRHWIGASVRDCLLRYRYTMPKAVADSYLSFAREALGRGDAESAGQAIGRVLHLDLMHPVAQALLDELAGMGAKELATGLRRRFHLRHVRSFGRSRLKRPYSFIVDPKRRRLLVCDSLLRQVLVFSLGGRFVRAIALDIEHVGEVTPGMAGGFWVCDMGNKRLIRRDLDGKVLEEFSIVQRVGTPTICAPARAIELDPGRFAAAGFDDTGRPMLGELTRNGFLPYEAFTGRHVHLKRIDGQLVLRDHYSGELLKFDPQGERTTKMEFDLPRLTINYGFDCTSQGWFMIFASRALAKFTLHGQLEYIMHFEEMFGQESLLYDINIIEIDGVEYLYAVDPGTRSVHVFEI